MLKELILRAQSEQLGILAYSGGPDINYAQLELGRYMMEQGPTVVKQLEDAERMLAWMEPLKIMLEHKAKETEGNLQDFIFDLVDYLEMALGQ